MNSDLPTSWFYAYNDVSIGPVTFEELESLLQSAVIQPDTWVVQEGHEDWKPLAEVLPSLLTQPPSPPPLPVTGSADKRKGSPWYLRPRVVLPTVLLCLFLGCIGLGVLVALGRAASRWTSESGAQSATGRGTPNSKSIGEGVVPKKTTLYADRETLRTIETEWDKGEATGTAATQRLRSEGKLWTEDYDLHVDVLERGGPLRGMLVEVRSGSKALKVARFWVLEHQLLPMSNRAAKWATDGANTVSKARFKNVFNGRNGSEVGSTYVHNFMDFVAGLYEGDISDEEARQCLFLSDCIGGENPCELDQVLRSHLIYEGVLTIRKHFQIALIRDPALEAGFSNANELYDDIKHSQWHSADPLYREAIVYEGMDEFTTKGGFVRRIPVFRAVTVQP